MSDENACSVLQNGVHTTRIFYTLSKTINSKRKVMDRCKCDFNPSFVPTNVMLNFHTSH